MASFSDSKSLYRASELILKFGRDSFCWQILNPGITLWFSKDGQSVAGYTVEGNKRITGGAPVTQSSNLKEAVLEFEEDARQNKQTVCYFGAETWLNQIHKDVSTHRSILLGAQPVWNPAQWKETVNGKASLKELIRYALRQGVTVKETSPEALKSNPKYKTCLEEWLADRKLPALQFIINPGVLQNPQGRRFFSAYREGKLISFASLVPITGRNGWLIEHLFRGRLALKGTSELLIDSIMQTLAKEGATHATLGLAPLSRRAGFSYRMNPAWIRLVFEWLYDRASSFYGFSGLDAFKSKFKPHQWEPVYAIVNKPNFSPMTFYRIAGAFCNTSPLLFCVTAVVRTLSGVID